MTTPLHPHLQTVHHARGHQPEVAVLDSSAELAGCRLCLAPSTARRPAPHRLIDRDRGGSPQVPWRTWESQLLGCEAKVTTPAGVPGHGQLATYHTVAHDAPVPILERRDGARSLAVNGPARETSLMDAAEELEDDFTRLVTAFQARLRANVTLVADYAQDRQVLRALDRRGLDSVWAKRVLATRRTEVEPEGDDPEAA